MELQIISRDGKTETRTFPDGSAIETGREEITQKIVHRLALLRPEELREIDDYITYLTDDSVEPEGNNA